MFLLWWHWVVIGLVILLSDVIVLGSTGIVLWFGAGAVAVGLWILADPELLPWAQFALWVAFSLGALILWLVIFKPRMNRRNVASAREELIGAAGVVIRVREAEGEVHGTIRLQKPIGGRDVWEFQSTSSFTPGTRVTASAVSDEGVLTIAAKPGASLDD